MQVSPTTNSSRFLHGYWGLRQAMLCRVNPKIKRAHGLEFAELMLLGHIARTDMSPSEIAEALQVPAHAISRKLDVLERGGLIARQLDREDARRRVLSVTAKGRRTLQAANATLQQEIDAMLEVLEKGELERFLDNLETVARPPHSQSAQEKQ